MVKGVCAERCVLMVMRGGEGERERERKGDEVRVKRVRGRGYSKRLVFALRFGSASSFSAARIFISSISSSSSASSIESISFTRPMLCDRGVTIAMRSESAPPSGACSSKPSHLAFTGAWGVR